MLRLKLRRWRYNLEREWQERSVLLKRVTVSCLFAFAGSQFVLTDLARRAESELLHAWFWVRGPRPVPESILLLEVDSRTKQKLGIAERDPIPREVIAEALVKLDELQPKAVIFDFVFHGEGPDPEIDERLADALSKTPSVVGSASLLERERGSSDGSPRLRRIRKDSLPLFARSARFVVPMEVTLTGNVVEKIALLADPTLPKVPLVEPLRALVDPTVEEPGDFDLINYYGGPFTLPGIPFHQLVSDDEPLPTEFLRDKVLLIGWTERAINAIDPDRRDSFLTPASRETMYGVEIHATIAANLLEKSWLRRAPPEWEVFWAFVFSLLISLTATTYTVRRTAIWLIAAAIVWLALSYVAFVSYYWFVPAAALCGIVLPLYLMLAGYFESRAEAKRRRDLEAAVGMLGGSGRGEDD